MHVQVSTTIQTPAELIEDTRGNWTLVVSRQHGSAELVRRLGQLLKPYTTAAAVEAEMSMKKYTYEQTAKLLGQSTKWLQRRVSLDLVPYVTDGHRTWFELEQIRAIQQALRNGELDSLKKTGRKVDKEEDL
jgi:hypothetical protein